MSIGQDRHLLTSPVNYPSHLTYAAKDRLRAERLRAGLTQKQLSDLLIDGMFEQVDYDSDYKSTFHYLNDSDSLAHTFASRQLAMLSPGAISRYERGVTPLPYGLGRLLSACGLDGDWVAKGFQHREHGSRTSHHCPQCGYALNKT